MQNYVELQNYVALIIILSCVKGMILISFLQLAEAVTITINSYILHLDNSTIKIYVKENKNIEELYSPFFS